MENLLTDLLGNIGGDTLSKIGQETGIPAGKESDLGKKVFATLLKSMGENISQKDGEADKISQTLEKHHSNGFDLNSILSGQGGGDKIIGHILGKNTEKIFDNFAKNEGLDKNKTKTLFETMAPLFMGSLSKTKEKINADSGILGEMIKMSGSMTNIGKVKQGSFLSFFDSNKNGSILDEILNLIMKFFKKK